MIKKISLLIALFAMGFMPMNVSADTGSDIMGNYHLDLQTWNGVSASSITTHGATMMFQLGEQGCVCALMADATNDNNYMSASYPYLGMWNEISKDNGKITIQIDLWCQGFDYRDDPLNPGFLDPTYPGYTTSGGYQHGWQAAYIMEWEIDEEDLTVTSHVKGFFYDHAWADPSELPKKLDSIFYLSGAGMPWTQDTSKEYFELYFTGKHTDPDQLETLFTDMSVPVPPYH